MLSRTKEKLDRLRKELKERRHLTFAFDFTVSKKLYSLADDIAKKFVEIIEKEKFDLEITLYPTSYSSIQENHPTKRGG